MAAKIVGALVAVGLVLAFLLPPLFKLKDIALGIVIVIGIAMMLVDLWQSLQSKED
jgi:hypothetical protein